MFSARLPSDAKPISENHVQAGKFDSLPFLILRADRLSRSTIIQLLS